MTYDCIIMFRDRHQITFTFTAKNNQEAFKFAQAEGMQIFGEKYDPTYFRIHLKQIDNVESAGEKIGRKKNP